MIRCDKDISAFCYVLRLGRARTLHFGLSGLMLCQIGNANTLECRGKRLFVSYLPQCDSPVIYALGRPRRGLWVMQTRLSDMPFHN